MRSPAVLLALIATVAPIGSTHSTAQEPSSRPRATDERDFATQRERMVETQIVARNISQPELLRAMRTVPRHLFVPEEQRASAYADQPLQIGHGQTISQPYVVALMTALLDLDGSEKVLEIGTGSGYHSAVLSRVARRVYSVEILEALARRARETLEELGYDNVEIRAGDGYNGWPEEAPFDAIVLTAAPKEIPRPLLEQLRVGGRMVAPVGGFFQDLRLILKTEDGIEEHSIEAVRFVPMTGKAEGKPEGKAEGKPDNPPEL
ncbi:MAG TPA: protein-L-isoaspartate(D-aspartate) O-methyltransferase [Thermoanaerobaculia bacterium]|nr:protein-L-isoaspartate(D-aspartate) O-methyltransferase [Thermoanaerobaculia bacterium]